MTIPEIKPQPVQAEFLKNECDIVFFGGGGGGCFSASLL